MDAVSKKFMIMDELSRTLDKVDERVQGRVTHKAQTIFLVALAGVFAKCQTWNEIAAYGETKIDFLRKFIPDLHSTPSHDTLRRFFSIISPDKLETIYREWAAGILSLRNVHDKPKHIAIDGKCMRSAKKTNKDILNIMVSDVSEYNTELYIHIVSAYDVTNNISLAQECVPSKTNEITADKTLLSALELHEGDLVTLDALGTQKEIVELIRKKNADYLLVVKKNQRKLYETIANAVKCNQYKPRPSRNEEAFIQDQKAHGYDVDRYCFTVQEKFMLGPLYKDWQDIKTFGVFTNRRIDKNTGEIKEDTQYFITSLDKNAERLINYKREHWGVENGLHRTLDVEFNEDSSQKKEVSARNYSVITKMVMAILKANSKKMPLSRKRMIAGWDDNYMEELIMETIQSFM